MQDHPPSYHAEPANKTISWKAKEKENKKSSAVPDKPQPVFMRQRLLKGDERKKEKKGEKEEKKSSNFSFFFHLSPWKKKGERRGSNPRPPEPQSGALTS